MAVVVVTAAEVLPTANTKTETHLAGMTLTAGVPVYKKAADANALWACDADTEAEAVCVGITLGGAANGQYVTIAVSGNIDPGFTATIGETYIVSDEVGKIHAVADILAGDYVTVLGIATSASDLKLGLLVSGTARAA